MTVRSKQAFWAICLLLIAASACNKGGKGGMPPANDPPPASGKASLRCREASLSGSTASLSASILDNGGLRPTAIGVCYATKENPTVSDGRVPYYESIPGYQTFGFTVLLGPPDMRAGTRYFARAYLTNGTGTYYSNQIEFTSPLWVGAAYKGGVVAELDATGRHGMMATLQDLARGVPWAPAGRFTASTGATSRTDGGANTGTIVAAYGPGDYAAKLCRDCREGGFSDWYLPSLKEAAVLAGKRDSIGNFEQPGTSTLLIEYWTSTEGSNFQAQAMEFRYGTSSSLLEKRLYRNVRAVRRF